MRDVSPERGGADSNQVAAGGSKGASDSGSARNESDRGKHRGLISVDGGRIVRRGESAVVVEEGRRERRGKTDSEDQEGGHTTL